MNPKRITSHAVGVVFVKIESDGRVMVAIMNYTRRGRTTVRIPMGKGLAVSGGESIVSTFSREMAQEAADDPAHFSYKAMSTEPVYILVVPDDKNPTTESHVKVFFAAHVTVGELRAHALVEHEGTEVEENLGPLRWVEVSRALTDMSAPGRSIRCHVDAILATLAVLCTRFTKVWQNYSGVIAKASGGESPDSANMKAYKTYAAQLPKEAE